VARASLSSKSLSFRCPGCDDWHTIDVTRWAWNGDLDLPTISPSILVTSGHYVSSHQPGVDSCWCDYDRENPENPSGFSCAICHSFVRDGRIEFLSDCTHKLAGQTVDLPAREDS
jgi:hypothetical protein